MNLMEIELATQGFRTFVRGIRLGGCTDSVRDIGTPHRGIFTMYDVESGERRGTNYRFR